MFFGGTRGNYNTIKKNYRARSGEMAQVEKGLPHNHEGLT